MASLYTIRGSGGHPSVQVMCSQLKEEEFVLVASHIHQTPVEWELPLSPMVLGNDNMKTIIPSARMFSVPISDSLVAN